MEVKPGECGHCDETQAGHNIGCPAGAPTIQPIKIGEPFGWRSVAMVVTFNEDRLIGACLEQLQPWVHKIVVLHSTMPWNPPRWPMDGTLGVIQQHFPEVEVIVKYWPEETEQRNFGQRWAQDRGYAYCVIVDADEFYESKTLLNLAAQNWQSMGDAGRAIKVRQKHYWRTLETRLTPIDTWAPACLVRADLEWRQFRDFNVPLADQYQLGEEHYMHHLSYVRSRERVILKMLNSSHVSIVRTDWWKQWRDGQNADTKSCWPYPGADMRPLWPPVGGPDPCPAEIQDRVLRWEKLSEPFRTLDLAQVLKGLGVEV